MATVLVVDDVAANRELMSMLLGYRGHEVIEASDGADALALAQSRHPDVVVSDVLMPGIDGLEMVHRLRSAPDERAAHAPVIFYTANYLEPETRPIAEACGVSQVVLRSADPRELLDAVDVALRKGPVEITPRPADEFATVHARAINAKLVEKVRALRHTERRFEAMAASSPVGIVLLDAGGFATYVNPRLSEITAMTAGRLLERGWLACLEPATHAEAVEAVRAGEPVEHRYRNRFVRDDGDARWLRVHLRPIRDAEADLAGAVVMVDDVTDLVTAEERAAREMRQRQEEARRRDAERLDSLRRMAGGMAHDFNNLLGAMLGFVTLAIEQITEEVEAGRLAPAAGSTLLEDLGQVTKGGERATKLTEQLLAFGRREISKPVPVDVDTFLAGAAGALASAAGPGIKLDLRPGDAPPVLIDPRLLERLLHNLVHNARDAMPDGGTITVTTARAGDATTISVADDGRGMPAEVQARAFEPFFSTKMGSRTAGLGLATAHGVVTQAGGELTLTSSPGVGTTVLISLPAAAGSVTGAPAGTGDVPAPAAPPGRGPRTVLLVDDERDLREVTARFIARAGYHVLTAADGQEALKVAEHHPEPIHCLVTDVMMPGMDGRQLAHRFLSDRPETKVVFISGYAEALIDDDGRSLEPGRTILAKPFSSAELTAALASVLAA